MPNLPSIPETIMPAFAARPPASPGSPVADTSATRSTPDEPPVTLNTHLPSFQGAPCEAAAQSPQPQADPSNEFIGRHRLLGELGRGGMGSVLRARDPDLNRDLAIKVMLDKHRGNPEALRRFLRRGANRRPAPAPGGRAGP